MKDKNENLAYFLESLSGIKAAETKLHFYSKLTTRLELEKQQGLWIFPLKPIWMISTLAILLLLNTFILKDIHQHKKNDDTSSIENFARAYDQELSTY